MKTGEVQVKLVNCDGVDIGEYVVTDGNTHMLYSPYGNMAINTVQLKTLLRLHSNITYADLGVALLC